MLTANELMTKARAHLLMDSPFFGALSLKLKLKEDPTCATAWTDSVYLGYNPEWILTLSPRKIKGLVAHEVYHVALGHPFRQQHRAHRPWNGACDLVVNARLITAGFELPDDGLFDLTQKDKSPEEIYAAFPRGEDGDPEGPGGPGEDPGGCGEVREAKDETDKNNPKKMTEAQIKQLEQEWKQNVVGAAEIAKQAGNCPADIEKLIDELFIPQIDWREILLLKVDPNAKDDYSWAKRNRRFPDVYLPSLRSEQVGPVAIFMDTSGSMWGGNDLAYAKTELKAIFDMVKPSTIHILHIDTMVHKHDQFTPDDFDLSFKMRGGGGTSFIPGFEYLKEKNIIPEVVIYFTDLEGSFPAHDYGFDVLWVDTSGYWSGTVPFGQYFKLHIEG